MSSSLGRFAASAMKMQRSSLALQQLPRAAAVHTAPGGPEEPEQVTQDMYAREEHKWDDTDLDADPRASRFPNTLSVPEGAARVSMADFPSIMRSSLTEPGYNSFGFSLRDPPYAYVPKRRMSSFTVITGRMPAKAALPTVAFDSDTYQCEEHRWSTETPLPVVEGTWHKADC